MRDPLGKRPPRLDRRTLQLGNYIRVELPPPPERVNLSARVPAWPMMANDRLGDCTMAAAGHMIQAWTANTGSMVVLPDDAIIGAYEELTGYEPETGLHDDGAVALDVLNYWRKHGIGGHRIGGYAALEPKNPRQIEDAVWLFGGLYLGVNLPLTADGQRVWTVPPGGPVGDGEPGSWGGHAVPIVAYSPRGLVCVTWGRLLLMSWAFWMAYADEAYAVLSPDWVDGTHPAPNGFDLDVLRRDLAAL